MPLHFRAIRAAELQTHTFFTHIDSVSADHGRKLSGLAFGDGFPATALDASTVAPVARLLDAGREDLCRRR